MDMTEWWMRDDADNVTVEKYSTAWDLYDDYMERLSGYELEAAEKSMKLFLAIGNKMYDDHLCVDEHWWFGPWMAEDDQNVEYKWFRQFRYGIMELKLDWESIIYSEEKGCEDP